MKLFTILLTSFLLSTAVLSGQAGMTIDFNSDCTGPLTLTYTGTDATGRHMYGDENFNGPGNPVFSIFWDQPSGTWHVGLFGTGNPSNILYATGPNTFSPNPPDSATEPYPATAAAGCPGSATVSGSGTQSTAGTPCEGIGDDDMDGVCNDNDVCPGQDDTVDDDGDNIPDCNDPNPGEFDGVSFDSPCLGDELVFTLSGNDGTRNTYVNAAQGLEIVFDATNDRWEMRGANAGGAVIYFNTLASIPNPPSTVAMAWESEPGGGCSDSPTVGGNGTQDTRCAAVCDDGDPCTTDTLDDDCNCNSGPDEEAPTLTGCPVDEQDGVDNGSCMFETPDYTSLITVSDNCTSSTPTLLQIPAAGTLLGSGTFEIKLVATDLEGNSSDTCRITLNNADIAPPTAICLQDVEVLIDDNGMATLTPADLDAGSTDNCGITNRSLSVTDFTCDDVSTTAISVTLTVEDAAGGQGSCSSSVTVSDNIAPTFDCTDITVSLDATGEYFITGSDVFDRMIQNWDDNCAPAPTNFGSGSRTITCANITNRTFTYFFGAFDGNGQEAICTATITVIDPTLICDAPPVASCQDFQANLTTGETMYTVNAADFDNNSTDDNGIAGFVFSDQVTTIESPGTGGNFPVDGLGQVIKAEQSGFIQTIRLKFGAASSNRTIHLYNSNNGSGVPSSVGTPAYSQSGIELVDGTGGVFTEIRLQTPFPVTEGDFYSFAMEGTTSALYGFGDTYTDGQFLIGYNLNSQDDIDLAFEVDFLGSSTQEFPLGDHPVTVFAVDDAGQLSAGCDAMFTVDEALPVEWLSFSADAGAKNVELQWETTTEPDNAGFHLERSSDGNAWAVIAEQAPLESNRYLHLDEAPLTGENYYRVRQTDFDGTVTYSPVRRTR